MRTIVFSDVHGKPEIIERVIEDSRYDASSDRLIFAGDAVEIGVDSLACLQRLEELGAEYLVGNHEYQIFRGSPLEYEPVDDDVTAAVTRAIRSRAWRFAAQADGVLVTHAGVSRRFGAPFLAGHARDEGATREEGSVAARIAEGLNLAWDALLDPRGSIGLEVDSDDGPLWYRPSWEEPLAGVVQVVGHTPPEIYSATDSREWLARGFCMIDPCVRCWRQRSFGPPVPLRYAVIEGGRVSVVERDVTQPLT